MTDAEFDWDDWMDGRVVVALTDALWMFSEQCPEEGTDWYRISYWYGLMDDLASEVKKLCEFCRWNEGIPLVDAILRHTAVWLDYDAPARERALWFDYGTQLCGALAVAARTRWSKPPPDDDDDPI